MQAEPVDRPRARTGARRIRSFGSSSPRSTIAAAISTELSRNSRRCSPQAELDPDLVYRGHRLRARLFMRDRRFDAARVEIGRARAVGIDATSVAWCSAFPDSAWAR